MISLSLKERRRIFSSLVSEHTTKHWRVYEVINYALKISLFFLGRGGGRKESAW